MTASMATHKAATAVTIAPISEKSALATWVERYWKLALLGAIAVTGAILYLQHQDNTRRTEDDRSWDQVLAVTTEDRFSRNLAGDPEALRNVAGQVQGKQAGAWALYVAAVSAAEAQEPEAAQSALAELRTRYPAHPIFTRQLAYPGGETGSTAGDQLQKRVDALATWKSEHAGLFSNPELPADAPRVRIQTDQGEVVLGLFAAEAPQHVENFLKLVREGFYNGTSFHQVVPRYFLQAGDPNTIAGEPATWGSGGPGYTIPHETNALKHFAGVLVAAKTAGAKESSGSQFYLTLAPIHQRDGDYVVFGKVLEGMTVLEAIAQAPLDPSTPSRPLTPQVIRTIEVLEG